ncbi:hypothetical protein [Solicola gregarius]|uniref:Uncharacterized protein n=1 Tax=Solicola gregarius TaxID=2908642 RepID=A0AA46TJ94_9ACTN|nr:hypothetical protein [Solicola gregarius]UYM05884.1 hypothetical protein L0C25_02070 [Solicola gregarius]
MSLFSHYPGKPDDIVGFGDSLLSSTGAFGGLGGLFGGRTTVAASNVEGTIDAPLLDIRLPVDAGTEQMATATTVAGGALGIFAGAISTYNNGVDSLNRTYERAKAADFFAAPVGDDETGADGEELSDDGRKDLYASRVASARSALEYVLGLREAALMRDLDGTAGDTAFILDVATNPQSLASLTLFGLFGGGGSSDDDDDDEEEDDDDDDGGGLFSDIGGAVSGGFDTVTNVVGGAGEEVWDRGSTLAVYGWDTSVRRVTNPGQTLWDIATGTALTEDLSAVEGIVGEDGELYREGPYCGDDAACLTGVSVPDGADAITTGHTIRVSEEGDPPDDLVAHEMQHVYDIEDVGAAGFYGSYLTDYLTRRAMGESHSEAYEHIMWEQRAYDVGDNYPDKKPQGIIDDLLDKVF